MEVLEENFRQEAMVGYPVYKLLRAVNRQYPNNGFINYVDVREDMYDTDDPDTNRLIDEDLRDLINETLQEVYINIARDEVYSFPTVPGQKEYALPEDCDLRDIQEVTRTFRNHRGPMMPRPIPDQEVTFELTFYPGDNAEGEMEPMEADIGDKITLPECTFTSTTGEQFSGWNIGEKIYQPGDEVSMYANLTAVATWGENVEQFPVTFTINPSAGEIDNASTKTVYVTKGNPLDEVPTPTMEEGFIMRGFSKNGSNPLSNATILATPVVEPETYTAVTDGIRYNVSIYIATPGGTGNLHYVPVGGTAQTRVMTYGGTPFTFTLEYGQTIRDLFSTLQMWDSYDTSMVVNLVNVPITGDRDIPVAVPVVQPYEEQPGDNGDGGDDSGSGGAEPEDPGRDPEQSSGGSSSGGTGAQDGGRDPEPSDDSTALPSNPLDGGSSGGGSSSGGSSSSAQDGGRDPESSGSSSGGDEALPTNPLGGD